MTLLSGGRTIVLCAILCEYGQFHIHNAMTGREDRSLTAFKKQGLF